MLPVCFVEGLQQWEMLLSFNKRPQAFFDVSGARRVCPSQDKRVDYGFAFLFFLPPKIISISPVELLLNGTKQNHAVTLVLFNP